MGASSTPGKCAAGRSRRTIFWIAAIAMQHGLTLISRDRHFEEIAGLQRERW